MGTTGVRQLLLTRCTEKQDIETWNEGGEAQFLPIVQVGFHEKPQQAGDGLIPREDGLQHRISFVSNVQLRRL